MPPAGAANRLVGGLRPVALADQECTVRALTGSELEKMVEGGCDVIKIDVFGADLMAMRQMSGIVERHSPVVVVEYRRPAWERYGARAEDALALFEEWGYAVLVCRKGVTQPLDGPVPPVCSLVGVPLSETNHGAAEIPRCGRPVWPSPCCSFLRSLGLPRAIASVNRGA